MSFAFPFVFTKGSHQKKKKIHSSCELSPKMENPPIPLFHNNFSHFQNLKIDVFCNYNNKNIKTNYYG